MCPKKDHDWFSLVSHGNETLSALYCRMKYSVRCHFANFSMLF